MMSLGARIRSAVFDLLTENAADLKVDGRDVKVVKVMPKRFSARDVPLVVVGRALLDSRAGWSWTKDRSVYSVAMALVDGVGSTPEGDDASRERVDLLFDRVYEVLRAPGHWGLEELNFSSAYMTATLLDEEEAAGNIVFFPVSVTVPVIVAKDQQAQTAPENGAG